MSGPSSLHRLALVALVALVAACGGSNAPEADPAKVQAFAKTLADNAPAPAGVPTCTGAELRDGLELSQRSLLVLAKEALRDVPERADWANPPTLDAPAVRTLLDAAASESARRQAAAQVLRAKAILVHRVDMIDVPIALMVKELKRGFVGMRTIRYVKGMPTCVKVFNVQNDKAKSEWAMDQSNKAAIDPAVANALREDLQVQMVAKIAELKAAP